MFRTSDNKLVLGNKDFLAGLVFLAFGLAAMAIADRDYPMGTIVHMGPGNFPAALGAILAFLGLYLAARGLWNAPPGRRMAPVAWDWRPVGCIVGSMLAFGSSCRGSAWCPRLRRCSWRRRSAGASSAGAR